MYMCNLHGGARSPVTHSWWWLTPMYWPMAWRFVVYDKIIRADWWSAAEFDMVWDDPRAGVSHRPWVGSTQRGGSKNMGRIGFIITKLRFTISEFHISSSLVTCMKRCTGYNFFYEQQMWTRCLSKEFMTVECPRMFAIGVADQAEW